MSFTTINYKTKGNKVIYESVEFHIDGEKIFYNTGDFEKDWYNHMKDVILKYYDKGPHSNSSSVDHFIMDGVKFESAYMKWDKDENPYLDYEYDHHNTGLEFFVHEGTRPTWKELKDKHTEK